MKIIYYTVFTGLVMAIAFLCAFILVAVSLT